MYNSEFLKKQHTSMFDEKRTQHRQIIADLWRKYMPDNNFTHEEKWKVYPGFYMFLAENFPVEIYEGERIIGTHWHWMWWRSAPNMPIPTNRGHYIPDFADFLPKGINARIKEIENSALPENEKYGLSYSLKALSAYIKHHAKEAKKASEAQKGEAEERLSKIASDCEFISENAPETFTQALQLIWFVMILLHVESGAAAISLGRCDEFLYPYYERDIKNGVLTYESAKEIVKCFYIKLSEGDESCFMTLGCAVNNQLTELFMEAQTETCMRQPSIGLAVSDITSDTVFEKAVQLTLSGSGMPAYFNNDLVIKGLENIGLDKKDAENYGIVGCYEAVPQGSFSDTVVCSFELYEIFEKFLRTAGKYTAFDEFIGAFKVFFEDYYRTTLIPAFRVNAEDDISRVNTVQYCFVDRKNYLMGITVLGMGVLVDSIYTVKKLVFDEKYTTVEKLLEQAEKNFEDTDFHNKIVSLDGFGTNSPESNSLAKEISAFVGKVIRDNPLSGYIVSVPALFNFTMDIRVRENAATVNGRRKGELWSYGVMPCASPRENPVTSVLLSAANVSTEYFPDGCPAMISLTKSDIKRDGMLKNLIKTYFGNGGWHLAVNTVDAELLRMAKVNPADYTEVLVKISGHSAKFVRLDEQLQDAIIERAEKE